MTKKVVKALIRHLDDNKFTTSILAGIIVKVTGIPVTYVKPIIDIVVHTLDRFINGKDDKDANDVNETPCVIQIPTPEPLSTPTASEDLLLVN